MNSHLGAILVACLCWLQTTTASGQAIARLYLPRPPAGAAYVRVVNPSSVPVRVQIKRAAPIETLSTKQQVATIYRIVRGGQSLSIAIDERPAATTPMAPPDSFVTLVLRRKGASFELKSFLDTTDALDGLKADLRFYNLGNCLGTLVVVNGPTVFDQVPPDDSRWRAINPIQANLVGKCGSGVSVPWKLPQLKPGDHVSLFLIGEEAAPILVGQIDATEPYRGSER